MTLNVALIAAAFITGLLGSVHCVAMCGGIVGTVTLSPTAPPRRAFALWYHLGRITSYAIAGAIAGFIGGTLLDATQATRIAGIGAVMAGGFMILLGLYLASWWNGLARLERLGARLWRRIEPYGRPLLPARRPQQALLLGMLWGWLPCGMVYSALAAAAVGGDAANGALIMAAFGLGTVPLLAAFGVGITRARAPLRRYWRTAAAAGLIAMGIYVALRPALDDPSGGAHVHHVFHPRSLPMPLVS